MRLKYLVANHSWVFVYGDAIVQVGNAPRFFVRLSDALKVASECGLKVVKGEVKAA
jgi:hypothetical protein